MTKPFAFPRPRHNSTPVRRQVRLVGIASVTGGLLWLCASTCVAQAIPDIAPLGATHRQSNIPPGGPSAKVVPLPKPVSKPEWNELTASQQSALAPLASSWSGIDEPRKRKWVAISQNFAAMPADEQARAHRRMKDWAALSPQQRSLARLNFGGLRDLPAEERREKWEAYQSLPADQRQQLAAQAPNKAKGAALAVKPVPATKLVAVPTHATTSVINSAGQTSTWAPRRVMSPKFIMDPALVHPKTLLPLDRQTADPHASH